MIFNSISSCGKCLTASAEVILNVQVIDSNVGLVLLLLFFHLPAENKRRLMKKACFWRRACFTPNLLLHSWWCRWQADILKRMAECLALKTGEPGDQLDKNKTSITSVTQYLAWEIWHKFVEEPAFVGAEDGATDNIVFIILCKSNVWRGQLECHSNIKNEGEPKKRNNDYSICQPWKEICRTAPSFMRYIPLHYLNAWPPLTNVRCSTNLTFFSNHYEVLH